MARPNHLPNLRRPFHEKPAEFPTPTLGKRKDSWRIRWFRSKKLYEITLGSIPKDEAKATLAVVAAALAKTDWPNELLTHPTVKRYLADIAGTIVEGDSQLIEKYAHHQKTNGTSNWYTTVKAHLLAASAATGNLTDATPQELLDFLNAIMDTRTKATRNRAYIALSGFYRWLRVTGVHPKGHNPLEGIKQIREDAPPDGIVVWEKNELKSLLDAADKFKDGIAVWIAIYAGLRRSEIARLKWNDITEICINITKSKTGKKRQVPLPAVLANRLKKVPRSGPRVVPWPEAFNGWLIAAKRLITEYLPRHLEKLYEKHPEKFGWNPFRHTFASRHAQAGQPLDLIAGWLGDSPTVCREHYARYVPANMRDTRIDLIDDLPRKPRKKPAAKKTKEKP